jgi:F0F1-type ATP synthase assembly protein I
MAEREPDFNLLGQLTALSQVGLEMAAAVGIGVALDYYLGWAPWASICGAIVGLVGGLAHLIAILNRQGKDRTHKPPRDAE